MNAIGSDPQELRRAAAELADMAASLHSSANSIHSLVFATAWLGPHADGFRDIWSSRGRVYLSHAAGELEQAAADLRRNADEQDQASRGDSSAVDAVMSAIAGSIRDIPAGVGPWFGFGEQLQPQIPFDFAQFMANLPNNPIWGQIGDTVDGLGKIADIAGNFGVPGADLVNVGVHGMHLGVHVFNATREFIDAGPNWWQSREAWTDVVGAVGHGLKMTNIPGLTQVGSAYLTVYDICEHPENYVEAYTAVTQGASEAIDTVSHVAQDVVQHTAEAVTDGIGAAASFAKSWLGL